MAVSDQAFRVQGFRCRVGGFVSWVATIDDINPAIPIIRNTP